MTPKGLNNYVNNDVMMELEKRAYKAEVLKDLAKELIDKKNWLTQDSGYIRDENGDYVLDANGEKQWGSWERDLTGMSDREIADYRMKEQVLIDLLDAIVNL